LINPSRQKEILNIFEKTFGKVMELIYKLKEISQIKAREKRAKSIFPTGKKELNKFSKLKIAEAPTIKKELNRLKLNTQISSQKKKRQKRTLRLNQMHKLRQLRFILGTEKIYNKTVKRLQASNNPTSNKRIIENAQNEISKYRKALKFAEKRKQSREEELAKRRTKAQPSVTPPRRSIPSDENLLRTPSPQSAAVSRTSSLESTQVLPPFTRLLEGKMEFEENSDSAIQPTGSVKAYRPSNLAPQSRRGRSSKSSGLAQKYGRKERQLATALWPIRVGKYGRSTDLAALDESNSSENYSTLRGGYNPFGSAETTNSLGGGNGRFRHTQRKKSNGYKKYYKQTHKKNLKRKTRKA
jgi:hypothetical protein